MKIFYQNAPELQNTFESDTFLKNYLKHNIPSEYHNSVFDHLHKVGELAATTWVEWAAHAEAHPPKLTAYSPWGKRIDQIEIADGWKRLEKAAATEGIVAAAYERKQKEYSRIYQMALLYLYAPSSAFFSCPLAMTDGAARALD